MSAAKPGKALVQADAGAYLAWSGADQPPVAAQGLGCGLLVLKPLGFAMPHYADSNKFGYVLAGRGVAGVLPAPAGLHAGAASGGEKVVRLTAGDVIAVRTGDVSWWYNDDDAAAAADLSVVFLCDTASAVSPGDVSYFFLAGANSVMAGFDAAGAFTSQPAVLLTKLSQKLAGVCPREHDRKGLVVNADDEVRVDRTGLKTLTAAELAALGGLGISAVLGRLDAGDARAPWVVREGAAQAVYVARGSARVQVSAAAGGKALLVDEVVPAGSMFVVPRFAVACVAAAGAEGVEWVSLVKSGRPVVEELMAGDGSSSVLGALTAQVVQVSLNVAPELVELLVGSNTE
ncbi:uncharacterized protein LOC100838004 [Brachypodium distachyon]|uniref:Cupin type-1 domain-containing protein n=1 Tax=Brachypodium distachyon TaxID=15368 RepID=I1I241_BRADI|nr:uncharacterized protein LOC100838004 [Brachypodium distachyon]KQJ95664.1 hypothetical protein BRADI_3g18430v3 [Brachypodium distachyon]|eukprot:XP_003571555.1 uncharacterized protein LOC100838004 [Brachypodium distachyon]